VQFAEHCVRSTQHSVLGTELGQFSAMLLVLVAFAAEFGDVLLVLQRAYAVSQIKHARVTERTCW